MIKMIVLDLDGTLLRNDNTISKYSEDILHQCREKGIKVTYATARGPTADIVAPAHFFDGRINSNGARAYIDDTVAYNRQISYQLSRQFVTECVKHNLKIYSQVNGINYSNFIVSDIWPDTVRYKIIDLLTHDQDADKLCIAIEKPSDVVFIKEHIPQELHVHISRNNDAMIMYKEATKVKAISKLASIWEIEACDIVVFSDDVNDLDMLTYVGFGVAMGNALDEVKAIANEICDTNNNDGIAKWIKERLL